VLVSGLVLWATRRRGSMNLDVSTAAVTP
jgi:hypothetical protein